MRIFSYVILVVTGFLVFLPPSAIACSCPSIGLSQEQKIMALPENGGAVFSGKVVGIVNEAKYRIITFEVRRFWKGNVTRKYTVATDLTTSSCSFNFEVSKSYLIFADVWEGQLYTGACSRNSELGKANEYLKILGKGKTPEKRNGSR